MICITGIPATGKTTVCNFLKTMGIQCSSLNDMARENKLIQNGRVDIDSLMEIRIDCPVVEAHYSHLLKCDYVIILKDDEEAILQRMKKRKYTNEKISENLDVQRSDTIYYEALDRLPDNRIFTVNAHSKSIEDICKIVYEIIHNIRQ